MRRLHGLVPGAYSRLGAAIRHGAAVLEDRGGTSRRLLVVLSDGLAYDHGYEPAYGAADARRALAEARRRGTGCLCLSIGASTDAETLRRVFGSAAHATIPRTEQLQPGDRSAVPLGPPLRGGSATADGPTVVAGDGAKGARLDGVVSTTRASRPYYVPDRERRARLQGGLPTGHVGRCSRDRRGAARRASSRRWPTTSTGRSSPSPAMTT